MRIIFMGTPEFSRPAMEALLTAGHEIVLAVTQPDKPKGRGKAVQYTPVKECAMRHGIPVFQPEKVGRPECVRKLMECRADVIVVVAFGQILPKEILEMTPYGCINVHASLLPGYRGAAPIQWAVINGEKVSGVTTMQMDEGLDTGAILLKSKVELDPKETAGTLHDKLAKEGAALCTETLRRLEDGTLTPTAQGESPTPYARMITKQTGHINWSDSAVRIENLIRGLSPWPGAYSDWNGMVMKIWDADVRNAAPNKETSGYAKICSVQESGADAAAGNNGDTRKEALSPGTVAYVGKKTFYIQTGEGLLEVKSLQLPGKKMMDADAFLRGYRIKKGDILQ